MNIIAKRHHSDGLSMDESWVENLSPILLYLLGRKHAHVK